MFQKDAFGLANNLDPDQTSLSLHCLRRPICLSTLDFYGSAGPGCSKLMILCDNI